MTGPRYFPGEREAITTVVALADQYGYGNLIARLKDAWSAKLQREDGMPAELADRFGGHICAWCEVDDRTGKKAPRVRAASLEDSR